MHVERWRKKKNLQIYSASTDLILIFLPTSLDLLKILAANTFPKIKCLREGERILWRGVDWSVCISLNKAVDTL